MSCTWQSTVLFHSWSHSIKFISCVYWVLMKNTISSADDYPMKASQFDHLFLSRTFQRSPAAFDSSTPAFWFYFNTCLPFQFSRFFVLSVDLQAIKRALVPFWYTFTGNHLPFLYNIPRHLLVAPCIGQLKRHLETHTHVRNQRSFEVCESMNLIQYCL